MERYIGLDVHAASCTLAIVSGAGKLTPAFLRDANSISRATCSIDTGPDAKSTRTVEPEPTCTAPFFGDGRDAPVAVADQPHRLGLELRRKTPSPHGTLR